MPGISDLISKICEQAQNILILPRSKGGRVGSGLDPAERAFVACCRAFALFTSRLFTSRRS